MDRFPVECMVIMDHKKQASVKPEIAQLSCIDEIQGRC